MKLIDNLTTPVRIDLKRKPMMPYRMPIAPMILMVVVPISIMAIIIYIPKHLQAVKVVMIGLWVLICILCFSIFIKAARRASEMNRKHTKFV